MAYCRYHPERPGVALCVRCRSVVCAACTTQLDGINHCHACLTELAQRPSRPARVGTAWLSVGLLLTGAVVVMWGLMLLVQGSLAP